MFKSKTSRYIIVLILCVAFSGCAGLQRKFTRKKKEEERQAPVIIMHDYAKDLRVEELYKKRFLFWRSWHGELIDRMGGTYKKRIECYDQTVMNLMEMEKYLRGELASELKPFIEDMKSISSDIKEKKLSKSEQIKLKSLLEKAKRSIDKKFSYPKVKDSLELRK
ncbi:MAG: hypothetical protein HQ532_02720 [Candidatus Omnitrophica bacterium]|nr:hypothetical protein [Candidatus Omnitrophota bacterium]